MNRTTKIFLTAGTVFCAAGLLMFGVGTFTGGREYVKNADLNVINGAATLTSNSNHAILEKTEIDSFTDANISLENLDLKIKSSSDDKFYISYNVETTDGLLPVSCQVSDGTLNLVESQGHSSSTYVHIDINFLQMMLGQGEMVENQNAVTLYIPKKDTLDSLSCQMSDGYATISSLHCKKLLLSSDYGDITLKDADISKGTVESDDGDIYISDSLLRNTSIKSDYGDLELKNTSLNNSKADLNNGDLKGTQTVFSGACTVSTGYGDISLSVPEENLKELSLNASVSLGDLHIPDSLKGNLEGTEDTHTYIRTLDSKNTLALTSSDGDISLTSR